jgi:hypothetical protein
MMDLVIEVDNEPGALAKVAGAISDAGVNISAATFLGGNHVAELHVVVPYAEAAKHSLSTAGLAVTREREVAVVDIDDRPGALADLASKVGNAGIDLDIVFVATNNRIVLGAADMDRLRSVLATSR